MPLIFHQLNLHQHLFHLLPIYLPLNVIRLLLLQIDLMTILFCLLTLKYILFLVSYFVRPSVLKFVSVRDISNIPIVYHLLVTVVNGYLDIYVDSSPHFFILLTSNIYIYSNCFLATLFV